VNGGFAIDVVVCVLLFFAFCLIVAESLALPINKNRCFFVLFCFSLFFYLQLNEETACVHIHQKENKKKSVQEKKAALLSCLSFLCS
jgi:hypothetical protein